MSSRMNIEQAMLLAVSGELTPAARKALLAEISGDPEAISKLEAIRDGFGLMEQLPIPEPSAEERRRIPLEIKTTIREALLEKQAAGRWKLVRWAASSLAAAACVAFVAGFWVSDRARAQQQQAQVASIQATIQRNAVPVNLAIFSERPANPNWRDMEQRYNAAATLRREFEERGNDPSAPAGSY